jgi:hypothetical protein
VCLAQPVPTFSTHEHCQRLAGASVPYSESIYVTCMNVEYDARAAVESSWPSVPGSARTHCIERATAGGRGSYAMLRTCLLSEPIPQRTQAPARTMKFFLRSPADREGTAFGTLQECMAAREKLGSAAASCIGR